MGVLEDKEFAALKDQVHDWEVESLPIIDEIKTEVTKARAAMISDPPQLYILSNSLVDLSILNIRLIDRIIDSKLNFLKAKGLYESRREEWKVKLTKGYDEEDPVPAGVADSMKVGKVREEYQLMIQAETDFDMVNLTRKAIEKTLDAIRSKLSYESKHET